MVDGAAKVDARGDVPEHHPSAGAGPMTGVAAVTPSAPDPGRPDQGALADLVRWPLAITLLLIRLAYLFQVAFALVAAGEHAPGGVLAVAVLAVAAAETGGMLTRVARRRSYSGRATGAIETATALALLLATPWGARTGDRLGIVLAVHAVTVVIAAGLPLAVADVRRTAGHLMVIMFSYAAVLGLLTGDVQVTTLGQGLAGYLVAAGVFVVAGRLMQRIAATLEQDHAAGLHRAETASHERAMARARAEQRRIVHGSVLQTLQALCEPSLDPAELPGLQRQARRDLHLIRSYLAGRDPMAVDDLDGLIAALTIEGNERGLRIEVVRDERASATRVVDPAKLNALRIAAGEALTNVAKHAGVSTATIRTELGRDSLRLSVTDSGIGFRHDALAPGFGLHGTLSAVDDVGGHWHIETAPGAGTIVTLTVPTGRVRAVAAAPGPLSPTPGSDVPALDTAQRGLP